MGAAENKYIAPDYTDATENDCDDLDSVTSEDEGRIETFLDSQKAFNNKIMQTTPFGTTPAPAATSTTPSWGSPVGGNSNWGNSSGSIWGNKPTTPQVGGWGGLQQPQQQSTSIWNSGNSNANNNTNRIEIDRTKKVVICNFLDCIVETWSSNGYPGFLPRDIYDLKPRFDVWQKILAINPEKVYMLVPKNLLSSTNGYNGWKDALHYYCGCLSSFLRRPYLSCQILLQNLIGQSKVDAIKPLVDGSTPINREDIVFIGINSGRDGQSNEDIATAEFLQISYVDLNTLLQNMF